MQDRLPLVLQTIVLTAGLTAVLGVCAKSFEEGALRMILDADAQALRWGDALWRPIDDSGVFYYEAGQTIGIPMPGTGVDLAAALRRHGFHGVVRCRLVDYVDCAGTPNGFKESGGSRVLKLGGEAFRVTAPSGKLSWFSCDLKVRPQPGRPHLLVCRLINDRERHSTITLDHAENTSWAEPYTGEEKHVPKNQEGGTWRRDVGAAVYTGREYYCDGRPFDFAMLFYPKTERATVTVSHYPCEIGFDERNGAAVSQMWMFEVLDPLPEALPDRHGFDPAERKLALYVPHPWFLYSHFGIPSRKTEWRVESLQAMTRYLKFCGFNQIQLHIINGSDRAGCAWYDSALYDNLEGDLFKELLPIAEAEGIEVVPIVAPLTSRFNARPHEVPEEPDEHGWSRDSCLLDRDGEDYTRAFGGPVPNPLRPEVQDWQLACFREILDRCAQSPAVPAVGFRVNGKIGLCFTGDQWNRCGQDSGYNEWMVREFSRETGIEVPLLKPTSYQYIRENCWDEWLQWRCVRTREFWLRCRDFIRSYRSDLKFLAACDLPSETPGYNIEWPSGEFTIRDLFRHHGYDPELFKDDEGIWIQRGMMVAADRYWFDSWFPYEKNAWAHKMFNYAPGVAESYSVPDSSGVELYHNYWEESPHPQPQYGPYMRTATPVAFGDFFYEPAVFSIRKVNVDRIAFMGWQRACAGHEHDIRRFARAFRSIPIAVPRVFDGTIEILENGPQLAEQNLPPDYRKPEHDVLWAGWFDGRLAVINDAFCARRVRLSFTRPAGAGESLIEYGSGRRVQAAESDGRVMLDLELRPFDLQVFGFGRQPEPPKTGPQTVERCVTLRVRSAPPSVVAGEDAEFEVELINGSAAPLRDAVLNVTLPRGWTEKSGDVRTVTALAPGAKHAFTVRCTTRDTAAGSIGTAGLSVSFSGGDGTGRVHTTVPVYAFAPVAVLQETPVFFGAPGETVRAGVELVNRSGAPISGRLEIDLPSAWRTTVIEPLTVEPDRSVHVPVDITPPESAALRRVAGSARFLADGWASEPAPVTVEVVLRCPRADQRPDVDGSLHEWRDRAVVVDTGLFRADSGTDIGAVSALSPRAWFAWDDEHFYVAVSTADTRFSNPFPDNEMWKGDSLQIGLDMHRSEPGPRGFFEIGFTAAADGGTRVRVFRTPHGRENLAGDPSAFRVGRTGAGTEYEAALRWSDLGFRPDPGDIIGVALVINDYDGAKRRVITFGSGLAGDKDPSGFVGLRLED